MKKLISLFAALCLCIGMCAVPAAAAQDIVVSDLLTVSGDYDWDRLAGQGITLNVYNWGEYISDGSDDTLDVIGSFEKLTGISVNYTTFDSNESMYAKIKSGAAEYDVVIPSDYMVARMINEEMLAPLNMSNIPNFAKMDDTYIDQDFDPGNRYSVPYMWCTTGIIYNTGMVAKTPTCWADLWDEAYAGDLLMFNNSRDAFAIAAFKLGNTINPTTVEEVAAGIEELKLQKPLVQAYVMDEIFDKMEGGEAAIGVYYSGDAITMIHDNDALDWVFPAEGSNMSIDSMCIPVTSTQQEAAEIFINYMCETDVGVANCEYIGYSTPMHEVWENLDEELKNSEIAYPDEALQENFQVFTSLSDEINTELDTQWSALKSFNNEGNELLVPIFLLCAVALSGFNIWRKVRRRNRDAY